MVYKKIIPLLTISLYLASLVEFPSSANTESVVIEPIVYEVIEPNIEPEEEPEIEVDFEVIEVETSIEEEIQQKVSDLDVFKEDKQTYLEKYKEVVAEYSEYCGAPVMLEDVYTIEEIDLMCRCIMTEIGGGSFDAKVNVATVIFNRVEDDKFPNNPTDVITAPSQFAYVKTNYDSSIIQALEYAYLFEVEEVKDALYFQSIEGWDSWGGKSLKHYDGFHWFY